MNTLINAIIIEPRDNVAVAIEPIKKGEKAEYQLGDNTESVIAAEDIMIYHKLAIRDIPGGEPVVKYGEHIGLARNDIKAGEHVHIHNVKDNREVLR